MLTQLTCVNNVAISIFIRNDNAQLEVITCLLAFTASSKADGLGGLVYAPGHASADYYTYPKYAFEYAVKDPHTGDNKAQWEKRDGDVVKGAYSLVEPDGSLRVVEYYADDKSGFNAVVKRVGPNLHPTVVPAAPIYKAPIPVLANPGPIAPISIGPVAKYTGLASAPLITGPVLGGAVSSVNLYKDTSPVIVKSILPAPATPILPAPIAHAQILPSPIVPASIVKLPIAPAPYIPSPIIKTSPYLSAPSPIISPLGGWGGLTAAPLAAQGHLAELGQGLLYKGSLLPYAKLGSLDYDH
ncbi:unnamed protein product [Diatraea saccharalis]|uniref:Cuticle protein n=1 Tax=Diatraea saccharalis TaxID=40085 RepID=A0A9N9RDW5_9NEOP|nr:unnamed protein product [Diatraea saccharalis]